MGPRSSAIVGGTTAMHRELEQGLADLKGTEECLLFPTGAQSVYFRQSQVDSVMLAVCEPEATTLGSAWGLAWFCHAEAAWCFPFPTAAQIVSGSKSEVGVEDGWMQRGQVPEQWRV